MRRETDLPEAWSNLETWTIRKWIISDPGVIAAWQETVGEFLANEFLADDRLRLRTMLAAELRREAETHCCLLADEFLLEMAEVALLSVNWTEIAEAILLDHVAV